MKKIFRKEVIIGLIVIGALIVLFVGIDFLKGVNVFKAANYYYVTYTDVQGLAKSAPVTLNGFKVGQVRDIAYEFDNPGHVRVELSLDRNLKLPEGSKAILSSDLLGTASVALELAQGDNYHKVGDQLEGIVPKGMMESVGTDIMPTVAAILPKVDSLLASINTLVSAPEISASVKRLDAITANLETTTRQINSLLATLPPISTDMKGITGNVNTMTTDLTAVTGALKEVPLDSLAGNLQTITANLEDLSKQLNSPDSSLGKLTHDPALYNNLNSAVASLDSLLIDIKKNPKRYISIKLL